MPHRGSFYLNHSSMTTDKAFCREIADLLYAHGIRKAVLCPGSRNAPLIIAIHRHPSIRSWMAIDERSAAFAALGIASAANEPVAVVCTSGTAMLNFAPAIAEAYYRQVPLIAITADRPAEWIDQDDSQTIRQFDALTNIVKGSWNVPVETGAERQAWYVNRIVNDALLTALDGPMGPVHINVQLDVPLGKADYGFDSNRDTYADVRAITAVKPEGTLTTQHARALALSLASPAKVMIIAGFMAPDEKVNRALRKLAARPNVAVLCEAQANLHNGQWQGARLHAGAFIGKIDSVLSTLTAEQKEALLPDVVITVGGSLVSRFVKAWLRGAKDRVKHWHVGMQPYSVDCFQCLDKRIEMSARNFLPQLASAMAPTDAPSDYAAAWLQAAERAYALDEAYEQASPWTDYKAMAMVMKRIPARWNLQLSNGTSVRYAQLFDYSNIHRIDCNRGVSGIDGCTSTAVGASAEYGDVTLLITGDMSAQYDVGALASALITPRFKMVVLNNGGGGIFRFIEATSSLPEREECFCCEVKLPLKALADGYGFAYYEAASEEDLAHAWRAFAAEAERPAILNLITPPELSAQVLSAYFHRQ